MRALTLLFALAIGVGSCANAGAPGAPSDARDDAVVGDGACVPVAEKCNGIDDDCDDVIDDGYDDKDMPCMVGVGGCTANGTWVCADDGTIGCSAVAGAPTDEVCDGIDNDCDMSVDEDYDVGTPCDGPDSDVCPDGVIVCNTTTTTRCNDTPANDPERCDTFDNDCDGRFDEGFNLGMPCDGMDGDACIEGSIICNGAGGAACGDTTGTTVESCNGIDDDCRNGIDDPWTVGMMCSEGLGLCRRDGALMCNGAGNDVVCSAAPGAPLPETCGNNTDEDCNGADATCPANDLPAGAIDISAGGTFTADVSAAHDDNWTAGGECGNQGGRDVFYQFTLANREVVYFDTFGASFDTVVRVFPGACTALGLVITCSNDVCSQTRSQGAIDLAAGTYCLVVDQFSSGTVGGSSSLVFRRGGRSGIPISGTGSMPGNTTGAANLSMASCEPNTAAPDVGHFFTTCPGPGTVTASLCVGTTFDTVLVLRTGAATTADIRCSDDVSGCGSANLQSRITNGPVTGPNLHWLIVDGWGAGNGAYSLSYTLP